MAEAQCPFPTPLNSHFTAYGDTDDEAYLELARHIFRAHCNTEPPFFTGFLAELDAHMEGIKARSDVKIDTDVADVNAEIRGDIQAGKRPV